MDCIRFNQEGNLYVFTKPRVFKGTEGFLSRQELQSMELVSCDDTGT